MRETTSAAQTEAAGAALAAGLRPGDVVLVAGEMGAGKTTFVRGALRALGVRGPVTSPTFVLGSLYAGTTGPLAHLDLYRLGSLDDEDPGLLDPYFGPGTITFVEWPERAGELTGRRVARLRAARARRRRPARPRGRAVTGAIVGIDTSTPATATAVLLADGRAVEAREDPAPGTRPGHTGRLLALLEQALAEADVGWDDVERLAVGVGPGGFTGLRIGIATARALAQGRGLALVGVSSLRALAAGAQASGGGVSPLRAGAEAEAPGTVLAAIDARRGEAFAAAWAGGRELLAPVALGPAALAERVGALPQPVLAVGDGSVRFRDELERAGAEVPADGSAAHRVLAVQVCRLGAEGRPAARDLLVPDYRREPDARPPERPRRTP